MGQSPTRMLVLTHLTEHAHRIVAPLIGQPATLLHGDYWPGNIAVVQDHQQIVYDWQLSGIGPGILDLLTLVKKAEWWFTPLPINPQEIVARYRNGLETQVGATWEDELWEELWDHALMWRFLQEWVDLLALSPETLIEASAEQIDQVWLDPVAEAVDRRLG